MIYIIKPDDQVLDYCIYLQRTERAINDIHKFLGFYERWRRT